MHYVEMNIDEMKKVKETLQIHLKNFTTKLNALNNIETSNAYELKPLEMCYSYCIMAIKQIISVYRDLINRGEMDKLDESYFLKKMKEVQRVHTNLRLEYNKKIYQDLENRYFKQSTTFNL